MNSLKSFIFILAACFAVPTFFMAVLPYTLERHREPVLYVMKEPGSDNPYDPEGLHGLSYPAFYIGDNKRGELVYSRQGCAQCHTQVIRPDYAGVDQFKVQWGADQEGTGEPARQTLMWDYMHEDYAQIGRRRIGPDLANAGYRFAGKVNELYLYLYAPRVRKPWSNSPGYPNLFTKRRIEGKGSVDALTLPPDLAPEQGWEIVPTSEARALAGYIMGLKRDQPVPASITGAKPKQEES